MKFPRLLAVSVEELKDRYLQACKLKQAVNWDRIVECFQEWMTELGIEASPILRIQKTGLLQNALRLAGTARKASLAWNASTPMVSPGTRAAWKANAACTARIASDARSAPSALLAVNLSNSLPIQTARVARNANALDQMAARPGWRPLPTGPFRPSAAAMRLIRNANVATEAWDVAVVSVAAIGALELGSGTELFKWYPLFKAFEAGAFCFFITDQGIEVCTIPSVSIEEDRRRLHSESGPAFAWLDDVRDFYWHGVKVEPYVVESPGFITVSDIQLEANVEVRRVKIERFGQARYLLHSGAEEIHSDDWGTLFRKELPGDEPLMLVKVVNSTPEPDGSFKEYFLRVPPAMRTAREAVAWTFGKTSADYAPDQET